MNKCENREKGVGQRKLKYIIHDVQEEEISRDQT